MAVVFLVPLVESDTTARALSPDDDAPVLINAGRRCGERVREKFPPNGPSCLPATIDPAAVARLEPKIFPRNATGIREDVAGPPPGRVATVPPSRV